MKRLAIVGAGDLGQLIGHYAKDFGFEVAGFLDDSQAPGSKTELGPVLGPTADAEKMFQAGSFEAMACAIGYKHPGFRKLVFERLVGTIPFPNLVHPSCIVDKTVTFGRGGAVLLPGCVIDRRVRIGSNALLNIGCSISHDTSIGSHSFVGPRAAIAGFVKVGDCCFIGIGSVLIDNITIGDSVQTAGGAVVTKDILEKGLYAGVPAKRIER